MYYKGNCDPYFNNCKDGMIGDLVDYVWEEYKLDYEEALSVLSSNDCNFNVFLQEYKDDEIQPYHRLDFGDKYYKFEIKI